MAVLFERELPSAELTQATETLLKSGCELLFVDCYSPLALFQLNLEYLCKIMAELLGGEARRYDELLKTNTLVCRLLAPVDNDQVWKARRTYAETISVARLHMCQARMVGIDVRTLYLAHVFLHQARNTKGWSILGQAELQETFDERDGIHAVPAARLRDTDTVRYELNDSKPPVRNDASPLFDVIEGLTTHVPVPSPAVASLLERHARAAAAAATAVVTPPSNGKTAAAKPKRPTVGALHAYMSQLSTLTWHVDPLVHSAFVALESPLFGYWLQSELSAPMLRSSSGGENRNVATRSAPGDLWLIRGAKSLMTLSERICHDRDTTLHSIALSYLPLAVQVDANDFAQFVYEFWTTTARLVEETEDRVY